MRDFITTKHSSSLLIFPDQWKNEVTGLMMFAHAINFSFRSAWAIFSASALFAVVTRTMMKLVLVLMNVHHVLLVLGNKKPAVLLFTWALTHLNFPKIKC